MDTQSSLSNLENISVFSLSYKIFKKLSLI